MRLANAPTHRSADIGNPEGGIAENEKTRVHTGGNYHHRRAGYLKLR
jgi:hypothetical protein